MFVADRVLEQHWVLVATDYVGLGTAGPHPYLIGQGEGRSALDAIRAAHQLSGLEISDRTVVWGHSQGGHAALWTGGLAATYAPELDIVGVASLAPASDLEALVANLGSVTGGILFAAYALAGYEAAYADVRDTDYVDPSARTLLRELSKRCLADPRTIVSVVEALAIARDRDVFSRPLTTGPMLAHLQANTPSRPIPAPLLIAQGLTDPLVVPGVQRAYVRARCDAGQALEYLAVPDRDHVALVEADSPLIPALIQWTSDRFAGLPATNGCSSIPREP
jgi:acetyl esterase/lipase